MIGDPRGRPAAKVLVWLALALATVVKDTIIRNLIMPSIRYELHCILMTLIAKGTLRLCGD